MHQNLAGLGDLCHKNGALLIIDTVCTLGGVPFFGDAWGVDAMYSGSQKVIGAPPGAPNLSCLTRTALHYKAAFNLHDNSMSSDAVFLGILDW